MECPTAKLLLENYARAAMDYFEAADNLAVPVGQHREFAEAKKYADQAREKCRNAR